MLPLLSLFELTTLPLFPLLFPELPELFPEFPELFPPLFEVEVAEGEAVEDVLRTSSPLSKFGEAKSPAPESLRKQVSVPS